MNKLELLDTTRTARFDLEWSAETRRTPQEGEPNSFSENVAWGTTMGKKGKWEAQELAAYDENGKLVAFFSILSANPDKTVIGAFKIIVREDARRKGWGMRLLTEAENRGFAPSQAIRANSFSSAGRHLMRKWLQQGE
jgi:GNAT superfamily N-acetyltransferase